ncbi:MAG: O-antigen ligase family protein, partial [Patescibacteria group bacterium]
MHTLDKALLWVARIGVFFVPFVPLIIASSLFFPFITGKGFAFRIIVEVVFACYLLLALRRPEFRPKRSLILYGVLAFITAVFLADAFAVNPFKAFWSNFERMEGFVTMIHLVAYFVVAAAVLNTEKWWHRFFATSVGVSAFLSIYGILQLAGKIVINQGGVRLDGTFGNAAYFAGYMLFHIFLSLFLILRHRIPPMYKWMYGAAIALQIFTLIFTATRGAALGLVGGLSLAFLLVALFERNNRRLRMGAAGAFLALVLVVVGLSAARDVSFVKNSSALTRFASVSVSDAGPRLMVWGMAWRGFKENPVFGWGQEGFNYVFNKYYNPDMWTQEQWFDRTHNIFFDWLISAGLLGLLSYLSLFTFLLWYIWKGKPADGEPAFSFTEKSVLSGLLAGYMVHNFFVFDNLISYILFFSLLAYVHTRFGKPFPLLERKNTSLQSDRTTSISGAVLLVLLCLSIYYVNLRPLGVAGDLIQAL